MAEQVIEVCSPIINGKQPLVVLTSQGRIFRLDPDPKSFAQGPNHHSDLLWTEIKGPPLNPPAV